MSNDKIFQMDFGKIYNLLLDKATRKGRTKAEVDKVICWLTGYSTVELESARSSGLCYGDFFLNAPLPNPNRTLIKGSVCGVRVEEIKDPLMREIRYLDKLIDELAKGKTMEKILRIQDGGSEIAEKLYISQWAANAKQHFDDGDYEWICDLIDEKLPGHPYHRLFEIGCGAGYSSLVFILRNHDLLAIDTKQEAISYTKKLIEEHGYTAKELDSNACESTDADVLLWKSDLVHETPQIKQYIFKQSNPPIELIVLCNPGGHLATEITKQELNYLQWGKFSEDEIYSAYQNGNVAHLHKWAMIYAVCGLSQLTSKPLLIVDRGSEEDVYNNLRQIQDDTGCRMVFKEYRIIQKAPKDGIQLKDINKASERQYWGAALYYPQ